jgi:transcriptional regulator with XRE-family HTH domain
MQQLNITQKQLAQYVMLPVSTVSAWLLGTQDIPYGSLWRLCELLNLDLHEVLEG